MKPTHAAALCLLSLAACAGDAGNGVTSAPPGTHRPLTIHGPTGTYRAAFVVTGPSGRDTLGLTEGDLVPPVPAAEVVSVELPEHSARILVAGPRTEGAALPYGGTHPAFLLGCRDRRGSYTIRTVDFESSRFCDVDPADAGLRAVALAPMWANEVSEVAVAVYDAEDGTEGDSLTAFTLRRPRTDGNLTRINAGAAAGRADVYLYLEIRWADGRERPIAMVYRGVSGDGWWAAGAMTRDPRAVPGEGAQHYEYGPFASDPAHPEVYVVALPE